MRLKRSYLRVSTHCKRLALGRVARPTQLDMSTGFAWADRNWERACCPDTYNPLHDQQSS